MAGQKIETPDTVIFVVPETLSDGSKVFNVKLGAEEWAATTEDDAAELAEKIREAIEDHSDATCGVVYGA